VCVAINVELIRRITCKLSGFNLFLIKSDKCRDFWVIKKEEESLPEHAVIVSDHS
jgi:hypothetical protein